MGRKIMTEKAISLPFSIDTYGKVAVATDQNKIWQDKVLSVIGTTMRERVMRPRFGSLIAAKTFDNESLAETEVQAEVEYAFNTQLGLLTLNSVTTSYDPYTGNTNVEIIYSLPNSETVSTTVGLVSINGNSTPHQENA
jgi:phage baseplate assembly protein W